MSRRKLFKKLTNPLHLNVKKVLKVAAGAAAIYFTGGAALPLIMKARAMKAAAAAGGEAPDYSDLLNEAWDSSNLSNNAGLANLVSRVRDNPLTDTLQQTARAVYAGRRPNRQLVYEEDYDEEEDVGPGDEEDDGEEDFE